MTIGVYKSNKNAGFNRFHRKKTHKEWKHYFLDVDEYEQGDYTFQTVNTFRLSHSKQTTNWVFLVVISLLTAHLQN